MTDDITTFTAPARSALLKAATRRVHDALDARIMAADIFATRERFAGFVRVQYCFHATLDALYDRADLAALIPELAPRRRLQRITADLRALGSTMPAVQPATLDASTPLPVALGWLYVAEGSNLGGAVLFKLATTRLGLDAGTGIRHLEAHADGAARHWRQFTAALDAVDLSAADEQAMIDAAAEAFTLVRAHVERMLPVPEPQDAVHVP